MGLSMPNFIYISCMMVKYNVLDILLVKSGLQWAYQCPILYILTVCWSNIMDWTYSLLNRDCNVLINAQFVVGLLIPDFIYISCMMIKYNGLDIFLVKSGLHHAYQCPICGGLVNA
jgi:hypothetical protein